MKRITQLLTALVFCSLIVFISCKKKKKSEKDDPRDAVGMALSKTWSPTSVTKDTENRTEWDGFTIGFTYNSETDIGGYSVSGVPSNEGASDVWGSGLSWTFDGEDESADTGTILRSDGVTVQATLDNPDAPTTLTLSFTITDASARAAGFNGAWIFTLAAN